eukprot:1194135-Prorocentrum_minimum.AAC.2
MEAEGEGKGMDAKRERKDAERQTNGTHASVAMVGDETGESLHTKTWIAAGVCAQLLCVLSVHQPDISEREPHHILLLPSMLRYSKSEYYDALVSAGENIVVDGTAFVLCFACATRLSFFAFLLTCYLLAVVFPDHPSLGEVFADTVRISHVSLCVLAD